jgi:hypothetical protein
MPVPVRKNRRRVWSIDRERQAIGAFGGLVIDVSNALQIVEANDAKTVCL